TASSRTRRAYAAPGRRRTEFIARCRRYRRAHAFGWLKAPPRGAGRPMMSDSPPPKSRRRIRALLLSDRIDTSNLEHDHVVSTAPLTYKFGKDGHVTLFRYGVAVLMGLTGPEENEVLRGLQKRL